MWPPRIRQADNYSRLLLGASFAEPSNPRIRAVSDCLCATWVKGGSFLWVSTLSGACVLCVLVRHLMG
jgi:hypothetical protein